MTTTVQTIRAPHGTTISCQSWQQEGALRCLMNNLDPAVAERPEVFEVQYTSGAFGWVVCHLDGLERDELAELTFEAWRLTAPAGLVEDRADRLPV